MARMPSERYRNCSAAMSSPCCSNSKALGIDNIMRLEWMDPTSLRLLAKAVELLFSLGAIDERAQLTPHVGHMLSELPLDPNLGRMLLHSAGVREPTPLFGSASSPIVKCCQEVLSIAAMLSVRGRLQPDAAAAVGPH